MPVVHFYVPDHVAPAKVAALAEGVHRALVETSYVPETDRFHVVHRMAAGDLLMDPTFPDVQRSPEACIVQVVYIEGRTVAQKVAFYRHAVAAAEAAGFRSDDIMLAVLENSASDWSAGGGRCFAAVD